jgi:hypothetical protein
MPWTYDPSQLATNEMYQVRAEIQDTDPQDPQLLDEEITYAISVERNYWAASARCCEMIGRKLLRKADVKLGRYMSVTYTKMAENWFNMARMLRSKALGTVVPYVGGMNALDKEALAADSSIVAPLFTKTMMENPNTGGYTTDSLPPVTGAPSEEDVFI